MIWNWTRVSGPAQEPLSIADVKAHARITHSREDGVLHGFIESARHAFEQHTNRASGTQTWKVQLADWFQVCPLPMAAPLQDDAAASPSTAPVVQYYDTEGTLQTLATSYYLVNTTSEPGQIERAPEQTWPDVQCDRPFPILITYVAGWTAAQVPELVKHGMRLWVASMDADRLGAADAQAAQTAAHRCWDPYRLAWRDPERC